MNTPPQLTFPVFIKMTKSAIKPSTVFNSLQYGFSQGLVVTGNRRDRELYAAATERFESLCREHGVG